MCGISGWYLAPEARFDRSYLASMMQVLKHRGPDSSGVFFDLDDELALGHNRLSIIDLSDGGHQPMVSSKSGNVLNFNGEIYNYQEIRNQLEKIGYKCKSQSDTEVLLYAFDQWGIDCLERVKGMYAISYWNHKSKTLYLVRDQMGIKPLYYWQLPDDQGIVFASEVKAFLSLPQFSKVIEKNSLNQYLEFGYTFDKSKTIFQSINKVPPGHVLTVSIDKVVSIQRFFTPDINSTRNANQEQLEEELFLTLTNVIGEQLISDVPIGILLSGGLDSSIVAAIAARVTKVRTFSFGFGQSSNDERAKARRVSKIIGSEHEEFEISPEDIIENLGSNSRHMDDLFADWGVFSTQMMYKKCRQRGIKVVLVGEGADELFGGYWGRFNPALDGNSDWKIDWRLFQMYRLYVARRYGKGFWDYRNIMKAYLKVTKGELFNAIRLFESREQLSNNFVMKVDKASMAESVEARVPFLDSRIAEIAYRIPGEQLIGENHQTKSLIRRMALRYNLLPADITDQQKFGIGLPAEWMGDSSIFKTYARDIILDKGGWTENLGFSNAMESFFDKNQQGFPPPRAISLFRNLSWKLLLLNLWSRSYDIEPSAN